MMILQIFQKRSTILGLLVLLLCNFTNGAAEVSDPVKDVCMAEQDSPSCVSPKAGDNDVKPSSHFHPDMTMENQERVESDSLLHRGMQGLEAVLDKMASSSDQMMHDMIKSMSESRAKMMVGLDSMMDRMSESRTKVMKGLDAMMEKVAKTREQMIKGFDNVIDQVSHSKMMEEIDLVLESIKQSKVMMEIRALPEEMRQSFILSARNQSYILAGVLVSISSTILFCGAIYYAWCHHDAWSYYIGTIGEAKALLKQYKESGLLSRSRSSSEGSGTNTNNGTVNGDVSVLDDKDGEVQSDGNQSSSHENLIKCDDTDLHQLKHDGLVNTAIKPDCDNVFDDDDVFEDQPHVNNRQTSSQSNK